LGAANRRAPRGPGARGGKRGPALLARVALRHTARETPEAIDDVSIGTPFHPRTADLNHKMQWREWSGYWAASAYADALDIEYTAIRESAALIDVSPLYKYRVGGPDAVRLVDRVITRDATKLEPGRVYYTSWCDEHGKVIDDGTVHGLDDGSFRWTAADPQLRWLRMNARGLDVEIEETTEAIAAVALQGPLSRDVLEAATGASFADLRYFRRRAATMKVGRRNVAIDVSRTGYTGDLGYELWVPVPHAVGAWDALMAAGAAFGVRPAGMLALDVVRLEAGLILLEVDYTSARHALNPEQNYSPAEIGLGRLVSRDKADFVGRLALEREPAAGDLAGGRSVGRARVPARRRPGRQGDEPRLEPDPQAGDRARVGAAGVRAGWLARRGRMDRRGSPGAGAGSGRAAAVPRPGAQTGVGSARPARPGGCTHGVPPVRRRADSSRGPNDVHARRAARPLARRHATRCPPEGRSVRQQGRRRPRPNRTHRGRTARAPGNGPGGGDDRRRDLRAGATRSGAGRRR
jgi:aminomethyltransferase